MKPGNRESSALIRAIRAICGEQIVWDVASKIFNFGLRGGFFAAFEVLPDADAAQSSTRHEITVFARGEN